MRKTIIALAAAVGALLAAPAYATTPSTTVHVVSSPDDGTPPWARDTFDRTTTVDTTGTGFKVSFTDDGTFRTPAGLTGHLHGEGSFVVTGGTKKTSGLPHGTIDRSSVAVKDSFTGDWWKQFVDGGTTPGIVDWKWTYKTSCETRVETPAGAVGDYPSKTCPKPSTSSHVAAPCEAYLYAGSSTNLCAQFPGDRSGVTCEQVGYQVQLRDNRMDPWGLDGSGGRSRGVIGLGCEGKPRKPSRSPSPSSSSSPAGGLPTTTTPADAGPNLPVTGPSGLVFAASAGVLLAGGGAALLVARRRRARFTA